MLRLMPPTDANPYDEVPYVGHAYNFTHPDRLSVVGALFGMRPAPVGGCRVLELGCGDGANLLPMAYTLPESRFFGPRPRGQTRRPGQRLRHRTRPVQPSGCKRWTSWISLPTPGSSTTSSRTASTPGCPRPCARRCWPSARRTSLRRASPTSATRPSPAAPSAGPSTR